MMGAALLSERLGLISEDVVARQRALLQRFGLPTACPGADAPSVTRAMELDKKVREKAVRWVLLEGIGQPLLRDDVAPEHVLGVIEELAQH
jgi:3-dehydroquinate synthetase